jgi:hypothetical protein
LSFIRSYSIFPAALLGIFMVTANVRADGITAQVGFGSSATDNVYLDGSKEWDVVLHPSAELGVDFADFWSVGYSGELNAFTRHGELLSHWHQLYLYANPAWGEDGQNELTVELSAETLRNQAEYSDNNMLRPALFAKLVMEPADWFSWNISTRVAYGWFYDDTPSNSLDAWGAGEISFTSSSRTTLSPRVAYGFRYYSAQDLSVTNHNQDQQVEAGLHLSQGLWESAGLQADYMYVLALGDSGLLLRKVTLDQFSYLDQGFLYSGSQAMLGFKQLLDRSWSLELNARLQERSFAGWQALDATGALEGEDRRDIRLIPGARLGYLWNSNDEEDTDSLQLGAALEYSFSRQWSNSDWYDASAHSVGLSLWGSL